MADERFETIGGAPQPSKERLAMPLRNFGLSFSRRGARPNGGIARPRHAAGIGFALVLLLAALWAMLAHAASDYQRARSMFCADDAETSITLRQHARRSQACGE